MPRKTTRRPALLVRAGSAMRRPSSAWVRKPDLDQHRGHAGADQHVERPRLGAEVAHPGSRRRAAPDQRRAADAARQVAATPRPCSSGSCR